MCLLYWVVCCHHHSICAADHQHVFSWNKQQLQFSRHLLSLMLFQTYTTDFLCWTQNYPSLFLGSIDFHWLKKHWTLRHSSKSISKSIEERNSCRLWTTWVFTFHNYDYLGFMPFFKAFILDFLFKVWWQKMYIIW